MLSQSELQALENNIHLLSPDEQQEVLAALEELERRQRAKICQQNFLEFCKHMNEDYVVGAHHKRLGDLLTLMERGEKDRIAVSIAPRHGKSEMISVLFPAWYLGNRPTEQIMLVSHTADLAIDFGRKVRNLIASDKYREVFPMNALSADHSASVPTA